MRIYISGKITGLELSVAEGLFEEVENSLRAAGYEPVNPCKLLPYSPELSWKDYMAKDMAAILDCDAMFMLENWRSSKGAKVEHEIAQALGLKVYYSTHHNLF